MNQVPFSDQDSVLGILRFRAIWLIHNPFADCAILATSTLRVGSHNGNRYPPIGFVLTDQKGEYVIPGGPGVWDRRRLATAYNYAGKFPEDGSGFANVGGHFLPYDAGNFEFASKPGLQKCDQEKALYNLNQNVLNAGPTIAEQELIAGNPGWYTPTAARTCPSSVTHVLNENFVPTSWASQDATSVSFYQTVIARSRRTCHVAMIEGFNFDHYANVVTANGTDQLPGGSFDFEVTACGVSSSDTNPQPWNTMPNSLVTFNRFWLSYLNTLGLPDQATSLINFANDTGNGGFCVPQPPL